MLLANDDRPRTMHTEAERTERHLLPDVASDLIERHEQRRRLRQSTWRPHLETAEAWRISRERIATAVAREAGAQLIVGGLEI
jgi:hypothetical protein